MKKETQQATLELTTSREGCTTQTIASGGNACLLLYSGAVKPLSLHNNIHKVCQLLNMPVEFIENVDLVRPGDRIVTSGRGGVLPTGLLIGTLALDPNNRLRARLAADYERLEFLKVLRDYGTEKIDNFGSLVTRKEIETGVSTTTETSETVNEGSSE